MTGSIDERLQAVGLPTLTRHAWVEVDLTALRDNVRLIRARLPAGVALGVVVKADGYGHGIEMAARTAVEGGAATLFVATLDEALVVRRAGVRVPLLILFPIPPSGVVAAAAAGCAVTIGDVAGAARLMDAWASGAVSGSELEVQLELETGMTRGGLRAEDALAVARTLIATPGIRLTGAWSHVASPDDPVVAADQARRFEEASEALAASGVALPVHHLASSGGVLLGSAPGYEMVRVGIAAYGVVPDDFRDATGGDHGLRPALSIRAHPIRVIEVDAGARAGYGGDWLAERRSVIATLPLGYADGYARRSWPGAVVLVRGRRVPVVGRISTDSLTVDVTDIGPIGLDEEVVLLGTQGTEQVDARELARVRGTIPWDVMSPLSARLPRVYREGDRLVAVRLPGASPVSAA